jgi:hypothetical protein
MKVSALIVRPAHSTRYLLEGDNDFFWFCFWLCCRWGWGRALIVREAHAKRYHYYFGLWDPKTARPGKVRPTTPVGGEHYRSIGLFSLPKDPYKRAKAAQITTLFGARALRQSQTVNSSPPDLR